ncbi:HigA family addiction module antitoxin [Pseudomonas sp. JZ134]|uniref:HigA family addiction module antitoxin n=1 Tax=Pseudomonas sp. JZ134 TaxID=2806615 RepID=UPI003DA085BE
MFKNGMRPIHPGEILREEFLNPSGTLTARFAQTASIPENILNDILCERQEITSDLALLLSNALGTTAKFWMNLQNAYDLRVAELAKDDDSWHSDAIQEGLAEAEAGQITDLEDINSKWIGRAKTHLSKQSS